jgi:tRNA threonylcarbamoyladenosine biosynthesis protein TsaB
MSKILLIDTALPIAYVAYAENGIVVASAHNDVQKDHASFLHPAIESILTNVKITMKELDAIAVTIGPGSYTGIRIGLAAAKGFCMALNKPLIGIHNLELLAHTAKPYITDEDALIYPMIDARRMEVFMAEYDFLLNELKSPYAAIINQNTFDTVLEKRHIVFTGDGAEKLQNIITHPKAIFIPTLATVGTFAYIANKKYQEKSFCALSLTTPLYAKEFYNM